MSRNIYFLLCIFHIQFLSFSIYSNEFAIAETCEQIMMRDSLLSSLKIPVVIRKRLTLPMQSIFQGVNESQINISSPAIRSPQAIGSPNFTSAVFADTFFVPPDSDGAVGPTQFLTVLNGRIRSHSKFTGAADGVLNTTLNNFFNSIVNGAGTSDPRVKFDRFSDRWFVICINVQAAPNRILIAVSNSRTLSNSTIWRFFFLDIAAVAPAGDANLFFDFPTLGIDTNALYIGGNLFDANNFFANSTAFVIQKNSILGSGPIVATAFRNLINSSGPITPQGVDNFDSNPTQGFFIGNINNSFLGMRIISNPGSTTPSISGVVIIPITGVANPLGVPSSGAANVVDSIDTRLSMSYIRNNQLWTSHNIGLNNTGTSTGTISRTGIRWYQFNITNPNAPTLTQSGTLFDSVESNPTFYWVPSLMTSGQGHMAMGFSVAGATQFINAGTVGRLATNPLGTLGTPILYTNSSTAYNLQSGGTQRWGDYSMTSLDPQDNMSMWTIQEFCNATNSYGCQVVRLLAPPPAAVSSATPPIISRGQTSVIVQINGSSINGSGFYDPGAGFDKRLTALVSGGIIVNSVTYNSPTSVILNLNTSFATEGVKSVIIKNPDGQQSSGSVIIVN